MKSGASLHGGLSPDRAAVPDNDATNRGQTHTVAGELLPSVQSLERHEKVLCLFHIKTYTVVAGEEDA